ncbi:MAG: AI-2E family transporter [Lentimicrobium sp.]|jgi:predicted PurR-regulated permease PerM|nr:AI-2E family transporter [Lentimicrobium sp.]MDD2527308.1 AI-2E family transporter [Lentimicrobiaceae bacterium]MDD4597161.1 AI-2E family transporter [Lentimicrobiaceae bacterium]MDY0025405.1 AI-2E family transporter [Lentimicrobium sp.]
MKDSKVLKIAAVLFILAAIITTMIFAKSVFVPLALSFFFAYLLYPVSWQMEKRGMHRGISIFLVILAALLILGGIGLFAGIKVSNANIDYDAIQAQVISKFDNMQNVLEKKLGMNSSAMDNVVSRATNAIGSSWESSVGMFFSRTTSTLFQIFLLPVFTFFVMFYRTKTAYFIFKIVGRENKQVTLNILREVSKVTGKYLGGILLVVLILAVLNSIGLLIIGVPNAILFGSLAALLNLIPYFGTLLGGAIPVLYVFFSVSDPFSMVVKIVILFIIIQFTENNLLTPNIVGNNIKLNPFAIIIGLLIANLIWGVAGMLIVVPVMAILKIVMRHIDGLKPYAYLLSDRGTEKYSFNFSKTKKKFLKLFGK